MNERFIQDRITENEASVARIEKLATLMDSQFRLPGTPINLGLDTIIGLIPGIGDTAGLIVSGYIISQGLRLGLPKRHLPTMSFNIFMDWLIGLVPIIGDIFDAGWKANNRNAAIIRQYWETEKSRLGAGDLPPDTMIDITPKGQA